MRRGWRRSLEFERHFIHVAPVPILTGLIGADDGMGGPEEVLGCVPSRRLVTASDASAVLAHAQMNPVLTTRGQALLAARGQRVHGVDPVNVAATSRHGSSASGYWRVFR